MGFAVIVGQRRFSGNAVVVLDSCVESQKHRHHVGEFSPGQMAPDSREVPQQRIADVDHHLRDDAGGVYGDIRMLQNAGEGRHGPKVDRPVRICLDCLAEDPAGVDEGRHFRRRVDGEVCPS
jgi:hypothetical protein